jgi:hypothetical protein
VVAIVVVLVLTGAIPVFTSPASPKNTVPLGHDVTYSQAVPLATAEAMNYTSAPSLQLSVALGIASPSSFHAALANLTGKSCLPGEGDVSSLTIPSSGGNYTSGAAAFWVFEFWQSVAPPQILLVGVVNGSAVFYGFVPPYPLCGATALSINEITGAIVDSSTAALAVATDAAGFTSGHSRATGVYLLVGVNTHFGPSTGLTWGIGFTTCLPGVTSSGSQFNASVNASSGAGVVSSGVTSTSCRGSAPILDLTGFLQNGATRPIVVGRTP